MSAEASDPLAEAELSEETKRKLRVHLAAFAGEILRMFPDYNFEETELGKRSRPH